MGVIQKFSRLIAIQKQRYRTKGSINIVIAGTLFLSIIWIANTIGKQKWPEHIQNEKTFAFIGSVFAHSFMQTVVFLLFLPGYLNLSAYYQKYRINKKTQKNWDRNNWPKMKTKLIKNVIINQFIIYPLFVFANKNRFRFRFHDFPTFEEMVWQIIVIYLIQDFFFYWGHRAFHSFTALYKMHKVHHQFDQLFTWITQYFHPIDFVVANILPSALGVMSLGANLHCFTYFYWICWKVLISFEGHSGYEFPWSPMRVLPLVTGPSYHDHHHSNNVGNFAGSCYLWDLIFNTNDEYMNRFLAIKVDQQKQD